MSQVFQRIGIIGSGNVAYNLGKNLFENGLKIEWVYGRNTQTGMALSHELKCSFVGDINELIEVDLILVCVNDDSLEEVISKLPSKAFIAYTSGSFPLEQINFKGENIGVFYPLQTFSKEKLIDFFNVPILIEAKNEYFTQQLFDLGWKLSRRVEYVASAQRKEIHLNAVIVNNFTNHLFHIARRRMEEKGLDWELLLPLIEETFDKVKSQNPYECQTGPARRKDMKIIESHLTLLDKEEKELYKLLSESIIRTYHNENV